MVTVFAKKVFFNDFVVAKFNILQLNQNVVFWIVIIYCTLFALHKQLLVASKVLIPSPILLEIL